MHNKLVSELEINNDLFNNSYNIRLPKWKDNVCRYDVFITLYLTTFEKSVKKCLSDCKYIS